MTTKFRVEQISPDRLLTWAVNEWFYWNQEVIDILKRDAQGALFEAAYDAIDWEQYYERLKGTPFYAWAVEGGGMLDFGGPAHIASNTFFSCFGDMSSVESDYLASHPEFNEVLHIAHVETATLMIDFLLQHAPEDTRGE